MSLVGAAIWVLATGLGHVAMHVPFPQTLDVVAMISVVASIGLFLYARGKKRDRAKGDRAFILDLGLGYLVLTGFAIGLTAHLAPFMGGPAPVNWRPEPDISWAGVVVVVFAALIPSAPRKTFVAGLLTVSANPIAMLIGLARGTWQFAPPINALLMHYPDFLLVGVATVISHVVTQLGRQVTRARAMGSYQLGELLAGGGMGEVYLATHRMLTRPAAIKLIRPESLGGDARDSGRAALLVRRFHREAGVAARLRSPHTVQIYDFGETEDGTLYLVMELLEGMNLETLVARHGPLPAPRVAHLMRQVCDSLEEAHRLGLVHRDVKPANINVGCVARRGDFVKVLDFGLVKSVEGRDRETLDTDAGVAVGTPAYMAPEMAFGEDVDHRADLYAVGCVTYFLLTGRTVFEAPNAMQMLARHLQSDPPAPSRAAPGPVSDELDRLVLACLAKDRAQRPESAAAVGRAFAGLVTEEWTAERALAWWETRDEETMPIAV